MRNARGGGRYQTMEPEKSRLEQFKEFVELDPTDTFSRYALGMEYMGLTEYNKAIEQFLEVIKLEPSDPAAYFQAARAFENSSQIDRAIGCLKDGIEAAIKKGDRHAEEEMRAALENLS
jgi:tetratricopeptide (TPR) repeat protein